MKRLGRVYADSFDLGRAIFRESKKLSNSDLRAQIHVVLTFEEMMRDERNEEMKMRWLLAIASELHRLERMEPEDDEERQMKADMLDFYAEEKTCKKIFNTEKGLAEQIKQLKTRAEMR